jgi:hypothetical protein
MKTILYKYLSTSRATYLDDELLRFTQPGALNDPFEFLPSITMQEAKETYLEWRDQKSIQESRAGNTKEPIKTNKDFASALDSVASLHRGEFLQNIMSYFDNHIGVFSLSRRWDSGLMWSHYAESHKGYCLGLWKNNLSSKYNNNPFSTKQEALRNPIGITYSDKRVPTPLSPSEKSDWRLFYTKSSDWKYEEEERLMALLTDKHIESPSEDSHNIFLFKIPHDWIAEITIGMRAENRLRRLWKTKPICAKIGL